MLKFPIRAVRLALCVPFAAAALLFLLLCGLPATAQSTGSQSSQGSASPAQNPAVVPASRSTQTPASATPSPLPNPPFTGPLQAAAPHVFDAGPFGQLDINGVVSGIGLVQGNAVPGDQSRHADLSNAQIFVQKTTGWWQFYLQGGAYNIPVVGTSFLSTSKTLDDFFGPLPVAFLKLAPGKNTFIEIGALPTLMGAESIFTFQNMNIERGLLWEQENTVNRGIQVNQTVGKFTASLSWNDGFYADRYSWLSGALTYSNGPHSIEFEAMGNLGQTKFRTLATPVQNNRSIYAVIYTYTKGPWIIQPYYQYGSVPTNQTVGVVEGASTQGGAVLVSRPLKDGFSLAGRWEYIASRGSLGGQAVNLLYGPGSDAWSVTVTPTYQNHDFFIRGEFSFVKAANYTAGDAFGALGQNGTQPRGLIEAGFIF